MVDDAGSRLGVVQEVDVELEYLDFEVQPELPDLSEIHV